MTITTQAQDWLDTTAYPFEHHYLQLGAGKMHYVDEGEGDVILFVHGTPTWSFLYRDYIATLSRNYRCIAIDHLGFGLSDKPESFAGNPADHSANLTALIEQLDLKDITLVVHDFGGPIGLASAIHQPDRIKQVVLFNTWLWATKDNPKAQKVDKILNSKMGEFLYLRLNFSPKVLLKKGLYDKTSLSRKEHKQYVYPFPDRASRQSLLKIGKALVGASDWYQAQWENLDKIEDKKWLILWGNKDEFITPDYLEIWKKRLPDAEVETFECGHFLQEEKSQETLQAIESFLER